MPQLCATRAIKNARHLQRTAPDILPPDEPPGGFASRVPRDLLYRLHATPDARDLARVAGLTEALRRAPVPKRGAKAAAPLFHGTLVFAQVTFSTSRGTFAVNGMDLATAISFARLAAGPISAYASLYGPNAVAVAPGTVPFAASVPGGTYNDQALQGWVNAIVAQNRLSPDTCVVILNPQGVVNSDADPSQGVGGYHGLANVPYVFVNVMGSGFTVPDQTNIYALALSHEIAEMVVDPRADLSNPEVCDPCVPPSEILLGDNKPISRYAVGDHVVGASGLQSVSRTFVRGYRGDLIEIKALGLLPFRVTPNHPLLVVRGRSRGPAVSYHEREWQAAGGIRPKLRFKDGDYLVMPRLRGSVTCSEVSLLPYLEAHRKTLKMKGQGARPYAYRHKESFPVTPETAWLFGLYVAEGSPKPAHRSVAFHLHANETAIVRKLSGIARSLGHRVWASPVPNERCVTAHLASVLLCRFFPDVCGKGAAEKRIPDFILYNAREDVLRGFLEGYMAGDGSVKRTAAGYEVSSFTTVSRVLALQLQLAYGRLGVFISLRRERPPRQGVIAGRSVSMKETYGGTWCSDIRATRRKRLHLMGRAEVYYVPVKGIRRLPYTGSVYNLETRDHTYLVANALTHNCGPNCQTVWIDYFDTAGRYVHTLQAFPPGFPYAFFINAIVRPNAATQCPAPGGACNYSPP